MNCVDPNCTKTGDRDIRGVKLCLEHYVEALEHSAHITSSFGSNGSLNLNPLQYLMLDKLIENGKVMRFLPGELKNSA